MRTSARITASLLPASPDEAEAGTNYRHSSCAETVRIYFEDYREPLFRYLQLAGATPPDAEDIVQETLIRLYRQLRQGAEITEVRPWVFHVAHNLLIDQKRRLQRMAALKSRFLAEPGHSGPIDPAADPEQQLCEQQKFDHLQESVAQLTELQRQCLSLRAEGLRYREIAAVLDLSLSTVADAVRRAVTNLRRRLE